MFFSLLLSKLGFGRKPAAKIALEPRAELPDPAPDTALSVASEEQTHQRRLEDLERQFDWSDLLAPMPTTSISENNSNTTWALFEEWQSPSDKDMPDFADTQPYCPDSAQEIASQPEFAPTAPAAALDLIVSTSAYAATVPAALLDTAEPVAQPAVLALEDVICLSRTGNRACPAPNVWKRLHTRLSSLPVPAGVPAPPAPLPVEALQKTAFLSKRLAFRSQIEWAAGAGHLEAIYQFMQGMTDTEWLYSD